MAVRFTKAMYSEKVPLPDGSERKEIRFLKERGNGSVTKAARILHADGTGTNKNYPVMRMQPSVKAKRQWMPKQLLRSGKP